MPTKRRRAAPSGPITRAQFLVIRRDVSKLLTVWREMESLRKDCATNLRRCAELQYEIDRLKLLLAQHQDSKPSR
jgi:hypothetical protein